MKLHVAIPAFSLAVLLSTASTALAGQPASKSGQPELRGVSAFSVTGPWEPQIPGAFSSIVRTGAGTTFMANTVGTQWVHIAMPTPYMLENSILSLSAAGFCAISTNPVMTKPLRMDLWKNGTKFAQKTFTWAANNLVQCQTIDLWPWVFAKDVTISVLLRFGQTSDKITLRGAEVVSAHP